MAARKGRRKFRSGWCQSGFCEGTKPDGIKTCDDFEKCPCECHLKIDKLFEAAGEPRILIENPNHHPFSKKRTYWMPGDPEPNGDSILGLPEPVESTENDAQPSLIPRDQPRAERTATGRKQKGGLEVEVLHVCSEFVHGVYEWEHCTPRLVAEAIGTQNAEEPPSTGAVQAVWNRWEKLEFAVQAKKPARFVRFTSDHSIYDLERRKSDDRKAERLRKAAERRGVRY